MTQAAPGGLAAPVSMSMEEENVAGTSFLAAKDVLTVRFDQPVTVSSDFSLTLTDGRAVGTLISSSATATLQSGGRSLRYTVTGTPSMARGLHLSLTDLEVLSQSGVAGAAGPWNLPLSGSVRSPTSTSSSTFSRVFGGQNADLTKAVAAPTVFDVIPYPTVDLPGPDRGGWAPEVIDGCKAGDQNVTYDALTGARLGQSPCPSYPPAANRDQRRGKSYLRTPTLANYEPALSTQESPDSTYISPPGVDPVITRISFSGTTATIDYSQPVTCAQPSAPETVSQFYYVTYDGGHPDSRILHYASSMTCPPARGNRTLTVSFRSLPAHPTKILLKYTAYGPPYVITAGTGSPYAGTRAASQSVQLVASDNEGFWCYFGPHENGTGRRH